MSHRITNHQITESVVIGWWECLRNANYRDRFTSCWKDDCCERYYTISRCHISCKYFLFRPCLLTRVARFQKFYIVSGFRFLGWRNLRAVSSILLKREYSRDLLNNATTSKSIELYPVKSSHKKCLYFFMKL